MHKTSWDAHILKTRDLGIRTENYNLNDCYRAPSSSSTQRRRIIYLFSSKHLIFMRYWNSRALLPVYRPLVTRCAVVSREIKLFLSAFFFASLFCHCILAHCNFIANASILPKQLVDSVVSLHHVSNNASCPFYFANTSQILPFFFARNSFSNEYHGTKKFRKLDELIGKSITRQWAHQKGSR